MRPEIAARFGSSATRGARQETDPPMSVEPTARPPWLDRLFAAVRPVLPADFCGQLETNIHGGNISNVNVRQSFRDPAPAEMPRSQ
jgi:hypothetical protein